MADTNRPVSPQPRGGWESKKPLQPQPRPLQQANSSDSILSPQNFRGYNDLANISGPTPPPVFGIHDADDPEIRTSSPRPDIPPWRSMSPQTKSPQAPLSPSRAALLAAADSASSIVAARASDGAKQRPASATSAEYSSKPSLPISPLSSTGIAKDSTIWRSGKASPQTSPRTISQHVTALDDLLSSLDSTLSLMNTTAGFSPRSALTTSGSNSNSGSSRFALSSSVPDSSITAGSISSRSPAANNSTNNTPSAAPSMRHPLGGSTPLSSSGAGWASASVNKSPAAPTPSSSAISTPSRSVNSSGGATPLSRASSSGNSLTSSGSAPNVLQSSNSMISLTSSGTNIGSSVSQSSKIVERYPPPLLSLEQQAVFLSSLDEKYELEVQLAIMNPAIVMRGKFLAMSTLDQLKDIIPNLAQTRRVSLPSAYALKVTDTDWYLSGALLTKTLKSFSYVQQCRKRGKVPSFVVVPAEIQFQEQTNLMHIATLMSGQPFQWSCDEFEVFNFRSEFYRILSGQKLSPACCDARQSKVPLPQHCDAFIVQLYLSGEGGEVQFTRLMCRSTTTTNELLTSPDCQKKLRMSSAPTAYLLRICGTEEYLFDVHTPLSNLVYVRESIARRREIRFALVLSKLCTSVALNRLSLSYQPNSEPEPADVLKADDIREPLEMRIDSLENFDPTASLEGLPKGANLRVYVQVVLHHAGRPTSCAATAAKIYSVDELRRTNASNKQPAFALRRIDWNEVVMNPVAVCNAPRSMRICFIVGVSAEGKKDQGLAWINHPVFDTQGYLSEGTMEFLLWTNRQARPDGPTTQNRRPGAPKLTITFPMRSARVLFPMAVPAEHTRPSCTLPTSDQQRIIERCLRADPTYKFTSREEDLLWTFRDWIAPKPQALIAVLKSIPWIDRLAVQQAYTMLDRIAILPAGEALQLLDSKFSDPHIRAFAIKCLRELSDNDLEDYLPQLMQVLKHEPYHLSALSIFLLERSHQNRIQIGNSFYWHLRSEVASPEAGLRFALLLEAYVRGCGDELDELLRESEVIEQFGRVAARVFQTPAAARKDTLTKELTALQLPHKFRLPLMPTAMCSELIVPKCRAMDSAKVPLWLTLKNNDPGSETITVIFKSGDDLRQDILTLQLLNIMDKLWQSEGLDLRLTLYRCIATGHMNGMIQVVTNAKTIADIQGTATGAFNDKVLAQWLREKNPSEDQYRLALENFIHSCAGYCVAMYVLGVGDRHNDNIMLGESGHLFHIDFGHFLGNFKKFLGLDREKVPFVFTPDFAFVMGGEKGWDFQRFLELCCNAFLILRRRANLFISLFTMMLSTGLPELKSVTDVQYLKDAFMLDLDEAKAVSGFKRLIFDGLNDMRRRLDFMVHIIVHK